MPPPFRLDVYFRPQIWGGRNMATTFSHFPAEGRFGEAWLLSVHPQHLSRVVEGPFEGQRFGEVWEAHHADWLGGPARSGPIFPWLVKWLDCQDLLSVQVHPSDALAQRLLGEPYGKSEAWYVMAAEPAGRIYAGLRDGVTPQDVAAGVATGDLLPLLHEIIPRVGDLIPIPAGTVHALGHGVQIVEVQQTSDATFRLFDWNRLGTDGKPRALHVREALQAIDWSLGPVAPLRRPVSAAAGVGQSDSGLLPPYEGPYFTIEEHRLDASRPRVTVDTQRFSVWIVLSGAAALQGDPDGSPTGLAVRSTTPGDCWCVPPAAEPVAFELPSVPPSGGTRLLAVNWPSAK